MSLRLYLYTNLHTEMIASLVELPQYTKPTACHGTAMTVANA